jgi:hypothetical protein
MVVDRHEIVAGKLVALLSRRAARDLFDARRIFDIPDLDWRWIKAAMLGFGAASRADWRRVAVDSVGADPGELRDKLLICLPRERFAAHGSAEAWITETAAHCRARLAPLLEMSASEEAFLDGVIDRGDVDATLLDVDPDIQARIGRMPMLLWKAEHVRQRASRGGRG